MNYARIYARFIADRSAKKPVGYFEVHHILPRCMGGNDGDSNLIKLTAGDHFFAHLLLAKMHGGALWYAVNAMVAGRKIGKREDDVRFLSSSRRWYSRAKQEFAKAHSKRMKGRFTGEAHPMFGKPCSPVALEKLRQRIADGFNPMASAEAKAKVSKAMLGREMSPEWREKIAASRRGKPLSASVRANMRAGHLGKKLPPETVAKVAAANRGKKRTAEQVEAMRARLIGRKLSPAHVEKLRPHLAMLSRFTGKTHSPETRIRMAQVCAARREYGRMVGGDLRGVTIDMMRAAGIKI